MTKLCQQCKTPAPLTGLQRLCATCKTLNAVNAGIRARSARKQCATDLGYESDAFGRELERLTIRTHKEVSEIMGCTPECSRQLERRALSKLRKAFSFELLQKQLDNTLRCSHD